MSLRDLTDLAELLSSINPTQPPVKFTEQQQAIICAPAEPLLVEAGAGTGKTATIVARVLWQVAQGAVAPEGVLGLTFTNKAAAELSDRLHRGLQALRGDSAIGDDADLLPTVLTYDAYAGRLVRDFGVRMGYEPEARLLTGPQRFPVAARVLRRSDVRLRLSDARFGEAVKSLLAFESAIVQNQIDLDDLLHHDRQIVTEVSAVRAAATADSLKKKLDKVITAAQARQDLAELLLALRDLKRQSRVTDFNDRLRLAVDLSTLDHVQQSERGRYGLVLLDEYQDTSVAQERLMRNLFGDGFSLTAVGDRLQAIYGWRGASSGTMRRFSRDFGTGGGAARELPLSTNYRSQQHILDVANALTRDLRASDSEASIEPLEALPAQSSGPPVDLALHGTYAEEVAAGVEWLRQRHDEDAVAWKDIGVLLRRSTGMAQWYEALEAAGVPVEVVGVSGLLEVAEIADLVALLHAVSDATANPSVVRLLAGPRWALGPADLRHLGTAASALAKQHAAHGLSTPGVHGGPSELDQDLLNAVASRDHVETVSLVEAAMAAQTPKTSWPPGVPTLSAEGMSRVAEFARMISDLQALSIGSLAEVVNRAIEHLHLDIEVRVRDGITGQRALEHFRQVADDFQDMDGGSTLQSFLAYLEHARGDRQELDHMQPSPDDSVKLMTVHQAKGLEWDCVLIPEIAQTVFPGSKSEGVWTGSSSRVPVALLEKERAVVPIVSWSDRTNIDEHEKAIRAQEKGEETHVMYVAVTRARRYLMCSAHWWGPTQSRRRGPSEFLQTMAGLPQGIRVLHWEDEPADGAHNPDLGRGSEVPWPYQGSPVKLQQRRAAAQAVSAQIQAQRSLAPEAQWPEVRGPRASEWLRRARELVAEAKESSSPVLHVTMPPSLSVSDIAALNKDRQGFAHRLRRPLPQSPTHRAASRGTRFHEWVESYFAQTQPLIERAVVDPGEDLSDHDLAALQQAFIHGPFGDTAKPPQWLEVPVDIPFGGTRVRGRIDAVYHRPNTQSEQEQQWHIVDWKTGQHPADVIQLACYRIGWAERLGVAPEQVQASFYYLLRDPEDAVETPDLSAYDRPALERILTQDPR